MDQSAGVPGEILWYQNYDYDVDYSNLQYSQQDFEKQTPEPSTSTFPWHINDDHSDGILPFYAPEPSLTADSPEQRPSVSRFSSYSLEDININNSNSSSGSTLCRYSLRSPKTTPPPSLLSAAEAEAARQKREDQHRRNRVAATKSREKKRTLAESLQEQGRLLQSEKQVLAARVTELQDEVLDLKHEVLSHAGCDSSVIDRYIANAAKRLV